MSKAELELQARTALLEYYKSLMQDYKIYIVTLAISILTIIDIWSRDPTRITGMYVCVPVLGCPKLIYLALGAIAGTLFVFTVRWSWCGQIVIAVMNAPSPRSYTMYCLDKHIKDYAYAKREHGVKSFWKRRVLPLAAFDSPRRQLWFALVYIFIFLVFGCKVIPWLVDQVHS